VPKPKGYLRIDLPSKKYYLFESNCPYLFEYAANYSIVELKEKDEQKCYFTLHFPVFNATLYVTYKELLKNDDIKAFIENSHNMAYEHSIKASSIDKKSIVIDSTKVYGLVYDIKGNAATPLQFYVTDSIKHFLRGALYFNVKPNYDSVKPVLDFIKTDIDNLLHTLHWKY
jgi:gliding motility-associated lipoprotein GldD